MKVCETCGGMGTTLHCPDGGFWSRCHERPCGECFSTGRVLEKKDMLAAMENDALITRDDAIVYGDYPTETVERFWFERVKARATHALIAATTALVLFVGVVGDADAAGSTKPRTCHALAKQLAGRGVTDRYEVDFIMHDRGCRKPYDIWIPATTQRCSARSYELWSHRVSDRDRRRNLRAEGCTRFEDGAWGATR